MKKVSLLIVLMTVVFFSNAQEAGSILVGGDLGLLRVSGKDKNGGTTSDLPVSTSFSLAPFGVYFLSENLAVGARLNLSSTKVSVDDPDASVSATLVGIAPMARYYALASDNAGIFVEGNLGLYTGKGKSKSGGTTNDFAKYSIVGLNITPGAYIKLTDKISLEAAVSLLTINSTTTKDPDDDDNKRTINTIGLGINRGSANAPVIDENNGFEFDPTQFNPVIVFGITYTL